MSGVKPDPMVGSGRYAEPMPVKSPVTRTATAEIRWEHTKGGGTKTPVVDFTVRDISDLAKVPATLSESLLCLTPGIYERDIQ